MKFFVVLFIFLSFIGFTKSDCNDSEEEGLKNCISGIFNALNKTLSHVTKQKRPKFEAIDERSCKIHGDQAKCLKNYEKNCLNLETFSKIYGNQNGYNFLMFYYLYEAACPNNVEITAEDKKCDKEVFRSNLCTKDGNKCNFKKYIDCLNDEIIKKCANKEFAALRYNSEIYALKKVYPECNV